MENQTSFDLNLAIQSWRENLAQSSALRGENLNELESHLRDSIATLQTAGLSGEEAFAIAGRRIGAAQQLETEFGKVNATSVWLDRLLWMLIGIQAWTIVFGLIRAVSSNLYVLGWATTTHHWLGQGIALPVILFLLGRLLSIGAGVWFCRWVIFRNGGKVSQWLRGKLQRRSSFVVCCIAASLLSILAQSLAPVMSSYLRWKINPNAVGEALAYMSFSDGMIQLAVMAGAIVFTLTLARKRFRMNCA